MMLESVRGGVGVKLGDDYIGYLERRRVLGEVSCVLGSKR